jgi:hypothetical protein
MEILQIQDDYLCMSKSRSFETVYKFCRAMVAVLDQSI